jgi:BirA family biotin operon repressor/biotin-[acetyl-CoA-carboxylase] ligase
VSDLDSGAIQGELDRLGARVGRPLSIARVTGSTNDDARAAAAAGAPHGAAFLADAQTAGRGRGGHAWHSPPGENLYLSVVLRPRVPAASIAPITLAIGVAAARVARARAGGAMIGVKWPNDVYAGGKKLAGVLVEGQLRGAEVVSLVAGVGMNVAAERFPPDLEGRATSLRLLGAVDLDRSTLAAALLAGIGEAVARFEAARLGPFLDELAGLDVLRGERVEVGGVCGVGAGIDGEGRLLVRAEGGEVIAVSSGEVVWGG